jgi:hypothetical protein
MRRGVKDVTSAACASCHHGTGLNARRLGLVRRDERNAQAQYPSRVVAYRCRACGNRTRFDVVTTSTSRAFHHYSLGGELHVEDTTVTATRTESVTCRWCGSSADVDVIDPDGVGAGESSRDRP